MDTATALEFLATKAANNLAIILSTIILAILITLYCCLHLSGTISQEEERREQ